MNNYRIFMMKGKYINSILYIPFLICYKRNFYFFKKCSFELFPPNLTEISKNKINGKDFSVIIRKDFSTNKINGKEQGERENGEKKENEEKGEKKEKEEKGEEEQEKKKEILNNPIETIKKKYKKLYIFYYSILAFLGSFFLYCVIKLLLLIFNEPPFLYMIKQKVLNDRQLIEEYEEIKFSKFWTGYVNSDNAKIVFNIRSSKKKKKGRIICTLRKVKDEWKIMTLTYYDTKRNENLKTDDLKTLPENNSVSSCPVNHSMFRTKNS